MKILLVEDDFYLSDIYKTKLEHSGFDVITVNDGNDVLNHVEHVDIVLLDIMIPNMNGLDLIPKINKPILIISNLSSSYVQSLTKHPNVIGYIVKSNVDPKDIVERVLEWKSS